MPEKLLRKTRNAHYEIFLIATGLGNPAVEFGNIIFKVAEENLEDRVTCTGLLGILSFWNEEGDIFRSAEALIISSVTALIQNTFREHRLSLVEFKNLIKDTIKEKSVSCLESNNLLKGFAKSQLQTIIVEIKYAIEKTLESSCENKDFIGQLFSDISGLRKPHSDIEAYKMVEIEDKVKFAETLITQLTGPIYEKLQGNIKSFDVEDIIERKGFTDFTFKEIVGCLICTIEYKLFNRIQRYEILLEPLAYERGVELLRSHNCKGGHGSGTHINVIIIKNSNSRMKLLSLFDDSDDDDHDNYQSLIAL